MKTFQTLGKNPLGNVEFVNKPSGVFIMDGVEVGHTLQCCHCNKHYLSVKGSGKRRGFCQYCNKTTCGHPACDKCVPFEEKLELIEGKKLNKSKYADTAIRIEKQYPGMIYF
jgi:hypothetical protein